MTPALLGAFLVALLAGAATLAIGQLAFALMPSTLIRALIALVFAIPAAVAGYEATFGLVHLGVASHGLVRRAWRVIGALLTGGTAFARMAAFATPGTAAVHAHIHHGSCCSGRSRPKASRSLTGTDGTSAAPVAARAR